jgi:hypothetical protein
VFPHLEARVCVGRVIPHSKDSLNLFNGSVFKREEKYLTWKVIRLKNYSDKAKQMKITLWRTFFSPPRAHGPKVLSKYTETGTFASYFTDYGLTGGYRKCHFPALKIGFEPGTIEFAARLSYAPRGFDVLHARPTLPDVEKCERHSGWLSRWRPVFESRSDLCLVMDL